MRISGTEPSSVILSQTNISTDSSNSDHNCFVIEVFFDVYIIIVHLPYIILRWFLDFLL